MFYVDLGFDICSDVLSRVKYCTGIVVVLILSYVVPNTKHLTRCTRGVRVDFFGARMWSGSSARVNKSNFQLLTIV